MKINKIGRFVRVPIKNRFWDKVNKNGPIHPTNPSLGRCWVWTGAKNWFGYGTIREMGGKRRIRAHRFSWELVNGAIPNGKGLLHSCDNPPCVNPKHTYPGTDADNHRDMVQRGRHLKGEMVGTSKLTEIQALDILSMYPLIKVGHRHSKENKKSIHIACEKYGITPKAAYRIASGSRWKHLSIPSQK